MPGRQRTSVPSKTSSNFWKSTPLAHTSRMRQPTDAALAARTASPENFNEEDPKPSQTANHSLPTQSTVSVPTANFAVHTTAPAAIASNGSRRTRMRSALVLLAKDEMQAGRVPANCHNLHCLERQMALCIFNALVSPKQVQISRRRVRRGGLRINRSQNSHSGHALQSIWTAAVAHHDRDHTCRFVN